MSVVPEQPNGNRKYLEVVVLLLIALAPALVSYGIQRAELVDAQRRIEDLERRVEKLDLKVEKEIKEDYMPRREYEVWKQEMSDRIKRDEAKLDKAER